MDKKQRSRLGKRNRTAGHTFERITVKLFKKLGWKNAMTTRYGSREKDDHKVDIMNIDPLNIQCKYSQRSVNYPSLLNEMPKDSNYNCIFHKIKHKGEYVIMSRDDFSEIIAMLKHENIM